MGGQVPAELDESSSEAIGKDVIVVCKRIIRLETKTDKYENKILVITGHRVFLLAAKVPCKIEQSIHFLELQAVESRSSNQVKISTVDGKKLTLCGDGDGDDLDPVVTALCSAITQLAPQQPVSQVLPKLQLPVDRMGRLQERLKRSESVGPCGGFSGMYRALCDYHHLQFMEDVAWDVDTIYHSQDCRELTLGDFDHLDSKHLVPIIGAVEFNCWFTKLNASSIRLTTEAFNEILKVIKKNTCLEELWLSAVGLRWEFAHKMSMVLLQNQASSLHTLDLSNNFIEDRGLQHLCVHLCKHSRGMVHLNISRTGITARGLNRLAEALSKNKQMSKTLRYLDLSDNCFKTEEITNLYNFLAQPNVLETLKLANNECSLENLFGALCQGCCGHLAHLDLHGNHVSQKKMKEVPQSWKTYFAVTRALSYINLSECRPTAEILKQVLLGVASNVVLSGLEMDLSSNDLRGQGVQVLDACLPNIHAIHSLNLADNSFDNDVVTLCKSISGNKSLKCLNIGKNFSGIKQKHLTLVLDAVVQMIQDESSSIERLSIADSKLKQETTVIINALGSNNTLVQLDISGNGMGDVGARMLAKALQINTRLESIFWDRNNTTAQGFQDIAHALNKNYTLRNMPTPIQDATIALKTSPEKTEQALQKVESLLQRNHSGRSQAAASDKAYRLQQGFLLTCSQQMLDQLSSHINKTLKALDTTHPSVSATRATSLLSDAQQAKHLLARLHEIASRSEEDRQVIEDKVKVISEDLQHMMDQQLKHNVQDMLKCTEDQCPTVMEDMKLRGELERCCEEKGRLPDLFTQQLLLTQVTDHISHKVREVKLNAAAQLSDHFIDGLLDSLDEIHKTLNKELESGKQPVTPTSKNEDIPKKPDRYKKSSTKDKTASIKQKHLYSRRLRPQSVIDQEEVRRALRMQKEKEATIEEQPVTPSSDLNAPNLASKSSDKPDSQSSQKPTNQRADSEGSQCSPKLPHKSPDQGLPRPVSRVSQGSPESPRRGSRGSQGSPVPAVRRHVKQASSPRLSRSSDDSLEHGEVGGKVVESPAHSLSPENTSLSSGDSRASLYSSLYSLVLCAHGDVDLHSDPDSGRYATQVSHSFRVKLHIDSQGPGAPQGVYQFTPGTYTVTFDNLDSVDSDADKDSSDSRVTDGSRERPGTPSEQTGPSAEDLDHVTVDVPKLEHLVKHRPRRAKVHAASRATVGNLDLIDAGLDSGVDQFFDPPGIARQSSAPSLNQDDVANHNDINSQHNGGRKPLHLGTKIDGKNLAAGITSFFSKKPGAKTPEAATHSSPELKRRTAAGSPDSSPRTSRRVRDNKQSPESPATSSSSLEQPAQEPEDKDFDQEAESPVSPKKSPLGRMALPGMAGGASMLAEMKAKRASMKPLSPASTPDGEEKQESGNKENQSPHHSASQQPPMLRRLERPLPTPRSSSPKTGSEDRLSKPAPPTKPKPPLTKPKPAGPPPAKPSGPPPAKPSGTPPSKSAPPAKPSAPPPAKPSGPPAKPSGPAASRPSESIGEQVSPPSGDSDIAEPEEPVPRYNSTKRRLSVKERVMNLDRNSNEQPELSVKANSNISSAARRDIGDYDNVQPGLGTGFMVMATPVGPQRTPPASKEPPATDEDNNNTLPISKDRDDEFVMFV